jgi:6-pyruvoyltetrahydropterin/6-carboxytetrahydropterin synthase
MPLHNNGNKQNGMYAICVKKEFKAEHNISYADGKTDAKHCHDWIVEVYIESEKLSEEGLVLDFAIVDALLDEILSTCKDTYLNDLEPFRGINPTAENISEWLYHECQKKMPCPSRLTKIILWEGKNYAALFTPK